MTQLLSSQGVDIAQRNFQQIIIRGDGKDQFNQMINQEISALPPSKNLEVIINDKFMFAKNSFDQWSLILTEKKEHHQILNLVSSINTNENILASDYSYGQVYFEIEGENKDYFLNQLTHFDLRLKKFPAFTMAETLIANIDCTIYNLKDKYIVTCNKSYEDYFKERLKDSIKL